MFRSISAKLFIYLLASSSLFILSACVATGPSAYSYNDEVTRMFESPATLLKDHTYYYVGTPVEPDAIIAIDNTFTLTSKAWSKIEATQKTVDDWAFWFDNYIGWWSCPYRGVDLLAPDGRKVGVGYSRWTFSVVKMLGPNEITVYQPQALGSCRRHDAIDDR